jgi:hypothetical protein
MVLEHVALDLRVADILTRPLAKGKFEMLAKRFALVENTFHAKRECQGFTCCLGHRSPSATAQRLRQIHLGPCA